MATHKSAVKRHKQSLKRNERNRTTKSTLKTSVKKTLELLSKGDVAGADAQAKATNRLFDKAAVHGILHKKTAARSVSRLYQKLSQAKQTAA